MAIPERDTVYSNDGVNRTVYTRESNSTAWFVGIIVALALLAIAYLVFSANTQPSNMTVNTPPATTDTTVLPPADNTAPMTPVEPAPTAPVETAPTETTPPATDLSIAPQVDTPPAQ